MLAKPPIAPMLARLAAEIPEGGAWFFEPKWDGFRAIVFRDGTDLFIQSREGKDLGRYFPELHAPLTAQLPKRIVLDGEIVIVRPDGLDFDTLQLRLHPAKSRIDSLSKSDPASFVFFDILLLGEEDLQSLPFSKRRQRLESVLRKARPPLHLTPATKDRAVALDWFGRFEGAGFDGVMAKPASGRYETGKRAMLKIKHERDCDCVVGGFRWQRASGKSAVGSLLLGLYDGERRLQHVGVCSSFPAKTRHALVANLLPYQVPLDDHSWGSESGESSKDRRPGGSSRWSQGKDLSFVPLRPELVVQVAYDHMQGTRFRHTAQFRRWRPDKSARNCTFDQLEVAAPQELHDIFSTGR
jgi:ATP-dependent DNA ligase